MPLNYTTCVDQLSNLMVVGSTDANFQTFLPGAIDYAEQRIYRECDFIRTQVTDTSASTTANTRALTLPTVQGTFITVDYINVITPAGTTAPSGSRVPLQQVDRSLIDNMFPSQSAATGTPEYYAMASDTEVIFGPSPDGAYNVEVIGVQRPAALSSANSSTFITQYCPDLFMAALMVFATGYQRDFGAQSDDPGKGASWENQYQLLKKSALEEQSRTKFAGEMWTSDSPSPLAKRT